MSDSSYSNAEGSAFSPELLPAPKESPRRSSEHFSGVSRQLTFRTPVTTHDEPLCMKAKSTGTADTLNA